LQAFDAVIGELDHLAAVDIDHVIVVALVGEVTTVIQTQANNTKLKFNPTATGADQDLCAVLDITGDAVGEIYTIDGVVGNAMRSDLLIGAGGLRAAPLILSEGDIELDCAASNTGSVAWDVWWIPLDEGSRIYRSTRFNGRRPVESTSP